MSSLVVDDVVALLDERYPPGWAEEWDRVGLVIGEPAAPVRRVLFVVDCVAETVAEAIAVEADLIVAHHPLLLRGVSSVATTTYKGRAVHGLIKHDIALYVAHTNADHANPGVSDVLAERLGLLDLRPLRPLRRSGLTDDRLGSGRIGRLAAPVSLGGFAEHVANALPRTAGGIRVAGDSGRVVTTVAVCSGAGDTYLADATEAGVDVYLTADLRHHPASEHLANGGPALIDAAHWATERPWLDDVATIVRRETGLATIVSDVDTDPWSVHLAGEGSVEVDTKEPRE